MLPIAFSRRDKLAASGEIGIACIRNETSLEWGGRWGLNPRPPESQPGALPTELRPPYFERLRQK